VAVPRQLLQQIRRLDEYELRRLMIVVRGLLTHVDGQPDGEPGLPPSLSYRQEHVRCGKAGCRTCPHGPYWYAYWKEEGRTRKRYVGRHLPGEPLEPVEVEPAGGDTPRDTSAPAPDTSTGAPHTATSETARPAPPPTTTRRSERRP
jgi:hypothetical protein